MSELINYPGSWNGIVPDSLKNVVQGSATITTSIFSRLEMIQHLVFPVYIGLEQLRVLDAACGTGEWLVQMALLYPQTKMVGYDLYPEAREQARYYISELAIGNLEIIDELPTERFDIIIHSRPLQHTINKPNWIKELGERLTSSGAALFSAECTRVEEIPEEIARARAGELDAAATEQVLHNIILTKGEVSGIDSWSRLIQQLTAAELTPYMGVHPANYEPGRYFNEGTDLPDWVNALGLTERGKLVEGLGSFERHYVLAGKEPDKKMPLIDDPGFESLIPHLSPYARVYPTDDDRYQVGLAQRYFMFQPGVELEDISLPSELFPILQRIDGKLTLEQLHRNFLPMSWERFLSVIRAAIEVEVVYLHRRN